MALELRLQALKTPGQPQFVELKAFRPDTAGTEHVDGSFAEWQA
jgi:hypothetical protein